MASPLLIVLFLSVILFVVHLLAQDVLMTRERGLGWNMGARDGTPKPLSDVAARADRAYSNFRESYPVFLAATILCLFEAPLSTTALAGATVWLVSRLLYLPLYIGGVRNIRSYAWLVSVAGLVAMLAAGLPLHHAGAPN